MVKGVSSSRGGSPATAGGSPLGRSDSASQLIADMTMEEVSDDRSEYGDTQDQGREENDEDGEEEEYEDKAEVGYVERTAELRDFTEELQLQVGRMVNPRPLERNLAAELSEEADDDDQGVAQRERPPLIATATRNADTPNANKILAGLGEDMKAQSTWMNMFQPMPTAPARWPVLGPKLSQPIRGGNIHNIVEETLQLLRAMGYRCNGRPSPAVLQSYRINRAVGELMNWKFKLREAFGLQLLPLRRPASASPLDDHSTMPPPPPKSAELSLIGKDPSRLPSKTVEFSRLSEDPSNIPLPKTPEAKKRERFRSTVGTPYYEDSHMKSPEKTKARGGRYDHLYYAADEAEVDGDWDDEHDYRTEEETMKDQVRHLSYDKVERGSTQYLELRSHISLDKITEFEGKRYRSDASLLCLKRFTYDMKGTRTPQNSWCEPFLLSLGRAAKSWYRQLPKKTQTRWNLLSETLLDYYCSQFDQFARTRYYSAKRKENEPIGDFLTRLNGYARTAKIQYEKEGADAADHVEQFLLNCGDDEIMDLLYPLQLTDIGRVEQIINRKILGDKRKKQCRVGTQRKSSALIEQSPTNTPRLPAKVNELYWVRT